MVKSSCLSLLLVTCFASASFAGGFAGTYTWTKDKSVKVIKVVKQDEKTLLFSAVTSDGLEKGCSGGLRATKAELKGDTAIFKGDGGFVMKMLFTPGKLEVIEEGDSTKYHPKGCNYAGKYLQKPETRRMMAPMAPSKKH